MTLSIVLGANGFIGSHLLAALAAHGREVTAVDRVFDRPSALLGIEQRIADLYSLSQEDLADLIVDDCIIYHLAWANYPAAAEIDPAKDLEENVGFSVRLFAAAAKRNSRVVFCSSGGTVYGEATTPQIAEDHPCRPISAYGASKRAAEIYADLFRQTRQLDVRIARLSNPFGSSQAADRGHGAVTRFARCAINDEPIEIWGDGSVVRDYICVEDAVDCLIRLAERPQDKLGHDPVFNVGSGKGTSLLELIAILTNALGRELKIEFKKERGIDVRRNVLQITRAKDYLDWAPRMSLSDGVERILTEFSKTVPPR